MNVKLVGFRTVSSAGIMAGRCLGYPRRSMGLSIAIRGMPPPQKYAAVVCSSDHKTSSHPISGMSGICRPAMSPAASQVIPLIVRHFQTRSFSSKRLQLTRIAQHRLKPHASGESIATTDVVLKEDAVAANLASSEAGTQKLTWPSRSHFCGDLRGEDEGERVQLCGWVAAQRGLGGMTFISLRDHTGVVQVGEGGFKRGVNEAPWILSVS